MKSKNPNSDNLYVKLFLIANDNYSLYLSDEKLNELMKNNSLEEIKKLDSKIQATHRVDKQAPVWIDQTSR